MNNDEILKRGTVVLYNVLCLKGSKNSLIAESKVWSYDAETKTYVLDVGMVFDFLGINTIVAGRWTRVDQSKIGEFYLNTFQEAFERMKKINFCDTEYLQKYGEIARSKNLIQ